MYIPPNEAPYGYIPKMMYDADRWSVWKKFNDGRKVPFRVLDDHVFDGGVKSNDPETWVSFKKAIECYFMSDGKVDGLGFALGDGWCGFDFDNVIVGGVLDPQSNSWLKRLGGYQEISQSGKGIKAILRGTLTKLFLGSAETGRQFKGIPKKGMATEVYDKRRFFFLTGTGYEVTDGNREAVTSICAELATLRPPRKTATPPPEKKPISMEDNQVLQAIARSRSKDKVANLWHGRIAEYSSHSEADMALASMLMFWCGNNMEQAERLFSRSTLGQREKWVERQDYRERTLQSAMQTNVYRGRVAQ